jgi:methyltransferase family protein
MEPRFQRAAAERYLRRMGGVHGWLNGFSARLILELSRFQTRLGGCGAVAEIGVHHGKLFLVLFLSSQRGEPALAIDVFGLQHLNLDKSGRGDKQAFLRHVDRLAGSREGLAIIEDSSLNLRAEALLREHGRIRLLSIDGAHTVEATGNDLGLADACLTDDGVVVVDDCFNEFWPEVSWALATYLAQGGALQPFAIAPGKVLLCRAPMRARYQAMLRERFPRRVDKLARLHGHEVTIVGVLPWTLRRRVGSTRFGGWLKSVLRPA